MLTLAMMVMAGCSQTIKVSAEEMVSNAITSSKEVGAYYAEASMWIYDQDTLIEDMSIKEYVKEDGVRKIITEDKILNQKAYALNDGKQVIVYEEALKVAHSMDVSSLELPNSSPREQFVQMLEGMKKTHSQKIVGEEKMNGFDTAHIKLIPNEKDEFMGEMDVWVDQKTWFIIKLEVVFGDSKSVMEYKTIDTSPKFEVGTFELEIPDSVAIIPIEDMLEGTIVTVEEAEAALGKSFLLFDEGDFSIDTIYLNYIGGDMQRKEVAISYSDTKGAAFLLTIFGKSEEAEAALEGDRKIRNQDAEYSELIRSISWDEDGFSYSVMIDSPEIEVDEIIQLAEKMVLSSEK